MTQNVTLYTKDYCPYCRAAKALLEKKGVKYTDIEITNDAEKRQEMIQRANGGYTVPQIFIGDVHVGGYTDLAALYSAGQLDQLLRSPVIA